MLKKEKIIGIPLWLYLILGVILMTAVYMGALPGDFTGAFAVTVYWGSFFMWLGAKIPIVNTYMGGQILLPLVACSLMAQYGIFPQETVATVKSLMSGGFQNLYIAALITGSILSMDKGALIKSVAKYLPCILVSQVCSIVVIIGASFLVRKDLFEGLFMVGLPCMAGGSGAAMTTLPTMYASMLGMDFDQLAPSLMAVLMVANILAIVLAAIMNKIGKAKPQWSGEGNLLMASGQAVKEPEDSGAKSRPIDIKSFGSGLLITVMVYTCGNIIGHIPGLGKIHMLAWTIIIACVLKVTEILPKEVETSVQNYFTYMMKNLLCVVAGGIGIASFNVSAAAAALTNPANLFIVVAGVLGATISAMVIGRLLGLYPIETGISVGLCSCNIGGSGDLAVFRRNDKESAEKEGIPSRENGDSHRPDRAAQFTGILCGRAPADAVVRGTGD